ncbi:MAG: hypothetical protein NDF54_06235 [archaeon GB-1867-035]|nr:hypothetical protein [Candidatus Culexmicrobium profundum]
MKGIKLLPLHFNRPLAVAAMLINAIGDGAMGMVYFFLFKKKDKAISLYSSTNPKVRMHVRLWLVLLHLSLLSFQFQL